MLYSGAAQSGAINTLYCFTGYDWGPNAGMIRINNVLYGTTFEGGGGSCDSDFGEGCGTVFSFDPATNTENTVYSFQGGKDGELPDSHLTYFNGVAYGTTQQGGTGTCYTSFGEGCGTVFSLDLSTRSESVLYSFQQSGGDGWYPSNAVVAPKSDRANLYGTTAQGGTGSCQPACGAVFKVNLSTGAEVIVHSFQDDGSDGTYPGQADWVEHRGVLYNTTQGGGVYGDGVIYSINPSTGAESVVHSFGKSGDGSQPAAGMTKFENVLYGTTTLGGSSNDGTVFSFDPATGKEKVLFSFNGSDGGFPYTDLIHGKDLLYGTTVDPHEDTQSSRSIRKQVQRRSMGTQAQTTTPTRTQGLRKGIRFCMARPLRAEAVAIMARFTPSHVDQQ